MFKQKLQIMYGLKSNTRQRDSVREKTTKKKEMT